jgi:lysozyme
VAFSRPPAIIPGKASTRLLALLVALALSLLVLAGCGSSPQPAGACHIDEEKEGAHLCVPDWDINAPGQEGSGVHPAGSEHLPEPIGPAPGQAGAKEPGGDPTLSANGARFIGSFEGFRSCPYWDPYGRVWTRGFGETGGISRGSPCISRKTGEANLRRLVKTRYELGVNSIGVRYNQNQHDSLSSFSYNLGPGIFKGNLRTQLRKYNCGALAPYNKAGGQTLPGLVRRRNAEVALCRKPVAKPKPPPFDRKALEARQRTLRRYLLRYDCRRRKKHHEKLGPKCKRWFDEGAAVGRRLRAGR